MNSGDQSVRRLTRRNLLRGTAIMGGAALLGSAVQAPARAAELAAPSSLIDTAGWGAQPARGQLTTRPYRPAYVVIDQTWTANTATYSLSEAVQRARDLQVHSFDRGLSDSPQNFLVTRGGRVTEGRHGSLAAARTGTSFVEGPLVGGYEAEVVTVVVDGDYGTVWPTQAMYGNLVHITAYLCQQYGIAPGAVRTPWTVGGAALPDGHWRQLLEQLQIDVTRSLAAGAPRVSLVSALPTGPGADFYPELAASAGGDAVLRLKQLLRERGFDPGSADDQFDGATVSALQSFQRSVSLRADGHTTAQTWTALEAGAATGSTVARGSSGGDVVALQKALNARLTAGIPPFGFFDLGTQHTVEAYQRTTGIAVDGVAGAQTWAALKAGR